MKPSKISLLIFVLILLGMQTVHAQESNYSFKELALLMDYQAVEEIGKYSCEKPPQTAIGDKVCYLEGGSETIAGADIETLMLCFYGDKLHKINIFLPENSFKSILTAMKEKYGEPKDVNIVPIQNRMGAVFENEKYYWIQNSQMIYMERYSGSIDKSLENFRPSLPLRNSSEEVKWRPRRKQATFSPTST